jgi:hypothetical protein
MVPLTTGLWSITCDEVVEHIARLTPHRRPDTVGVNGYSPAGLGSTAGAIPPESCRVGVPGNGAARVLLEGEGPGRGGRGATGSPGPGSAPPGISRALTLAGQAAREPEVEDAARDALRLLAERPGHWDVEGPTLCHGYAGVLRAADAMHNTVVAKQAAIAVTDAFDPTRRFGFAHVAGSTATDRPGFLTGAAGTALTLAEHATFPVPEGLRTTWDALLLLS